MTESDRIQGIRLIAERYVPEPDRTVLMALLTNVGPIAEELLDADVVRLAARHPDGLVPVPSTWPPPPDTDEEPPMNAGTAWVSMYPTSRSVDDLVEPFRRSVRRFLAELDARGCTVRIAATLRPPERAWLMHVAWLVAHGELAPGNAPEHEPRIPIVWSVAGAKEMVAAYDLAHRPSLTSRHIQGRAIDMKITGWTGTAAELYALGATFGVRKLVSDPPHWSDDGR